MGVPGGRPSFGARDGTGNSAGQYHVRPPIENARIMPPAVNPEQAPEPARSQSAEVRQSMSTRAKGQRRSQPMSTAVSPPTSSAAITSAESLLALGQKRLVANYRQPPFVLERGRGCELFDTEG